MTDDEFDDNASQETDDSAEARRAAMQDQLTALDPVYDPAPPDATASVDKSAPSLGPYPEQTTNTTPLTPAPAAPQPGEPGWTPPIDFPGAPKRNATPVTTGGAATLGISDPGAQDGDPDVPQAAAAGGANGPNSPLWNRVIELYQSALGRAPESDDVIAQWVAGSGGDYAKLQQMIYATPEAQAYGSRYAQTPSTTTTPDASARPTGGSLTDANYAASLVAWAAKQPGVNPSVQNDPNYWIGRFTSGAFGNDQDYAVQRMMQAEGAPEGSTGSVASTVPSGTSNIQTASATGAPQIGAPQNSAFSQMIRDQITELLHQAPVSAEDPDIAPAISANRVAQERSLQDERNQIAESNYAQHLSGSGTADAQFQAARERTGVSEGQFSGNLVAQQALARRNQITQVLQIGAGVMTADQQQQLQRELANMDAILRQQQITNQNNQFNDQLGVNIGEFQANLNRQSVLDAMGVHI